MNTCTCTAPTNDNTYRCGRCADTYARALDDLRDWLAEELDNSVAGAQGVRYAGNTGGAPSTGPRDLRVNYPAAELSRRITAVLATTVELCAKPREDTPAGVAGMAEWLHWRVDVLTRHPRGPSLMERLEGLVARAEKVVDRPPDHQYLGTCPEADCRGSVYAIADQADARCDTCGTTLEADARRTELLDELDDRLVTVAEAARLSTYLGLRVDRETVRKRINNWRVRNQIERHDGVTGEALVRFGEVSARLLAGDTMAA